MRHVRIWAAPWPEYSQATRHFFIHHLTTNVDQMTVLHTARAGRFAVAAGEATVQMFLRGTRGLLAFEYLLDEINPPARAIKFIAQDLIGGTGGRAKAAMHALAQNGLGLLAMRRVLVFGGELGLHDGYAVCLVG